MIDQLSRKKALTIILLYTVSSCMTTRALLSSSHCSSAFSSTWKRSCPLTVPMPTLKTAAASFSTTTTTSNETSPPPPPQKLKVIVLAGATAVGKSEVAARLQHSQQGILVSADSVQAYKGVQIGANKPTQEELKTTPHLLVNVAESSFNYNAAEWTRDANFAIGRLLQLQEEPEEEENHAEDIDDIHVTQEPNPTTTQQRHEWLDQEIAKARQICKWPENHVTTPIVCGGTMMYVQWLVHGRPDAPKPTPSAVEKAKQWEQSFLEPEEDWEGALRSVDRMGHVFAQQASKLSSRDFYRLRRIVENAYTVQEWREQQSQQPEQQQPKEKPLFTGHRSGGLLQREDLDVRCFFLCPTDRMAHAKVVDERCEQMITRGLIQETTDLHLAGELSDMLAKAIGYRQTLEYLGRRYARDRDTFAFLDYVEKFAAASRQYSAQQTKWYRKDNNFVFVPVPVSQSKEYRLKHTMMELERLLAMPRDEYDAQERLSPTSTSAETRAQNVNQARGMREYQLQRKVLLNRSLNLERALQEADECTQRFQDEQASRVG